MVDRFEAGATWMHDKLHGSATTPITYSRTVSDVTSSVSLDAGIGESQFEQAAESGVITRVESRDFMIRQSDLVLFAVATVPQEGDRIVEVRNSTTYTYEVLSMPGVPLYEETRHKDMFRVPTKLIDKE